ncbi:MAG: hypothetical protein J6D52_04110, partial [Clostridia bacterium]|nr:hypothetical protein [Clostridia bacterium]
QPSPSTRVGIGEEFGLPAGTWSEGQLATSMKEIFDYALDINFLSQAKGTSEINGIEVSDESSDEDYHSYTKASIGSINRSTKFYAYDITVMNNGVSDADKVYAPGAIVVKQTTRPEEVFKPGSSNPYNLNSIPDTFNFINAANGHQRSHRNTLIIKEVEELVDTDGSTYYKFTFGENLGDGDEFAVRVKEGAYNADTTNSFGYGFIDSPSGIQKGDLVGFGLAPNETDLADRFVIYATKDEYKDIDWS